MQTGGSEAETWLAPALEVMILYEDAGTALRARRLLERLPGRLRAEVGLNTKLWRLDLLGEPLLKEQAAVEAGAADVIILSIHSELPVSARDWLGRWLAHKENRPCAFGVLLDPEASASGATDPPAVAFVKQVTEEAGADLFCGFCEVPARPGRNSI